MNLKLKVVNTVVGMMFVILGCRPSNDSSCLSISSGPLPTFETASFVQGGYIQFGADACSATFDIVDVAFDSIKLKAYSARHCRLEYGLLVKHPTIHLYVAENDQNAGGYVKNIAVKEDFTERAQMLLAEIEKLKLSDTLKSQFFAALRIDTDPFFDPFAAQMNSSDTGSSINPDKRDPKYLTCLQPQSPKLPNSFYGSDICWSALDLGIFDLEIRRNENTASKFEFLVKNLSEKKQKRDLYFSKKPKLASFANEQTKDFYNLRSEVRLNAYSKLAYLLNFDHCKIAQTERGFSEQLCQNQNRLIELVGRYLIEPNSNGQVNIFDRLATDNNLPTAGLSFADLKIGRRLSANKAPTTFAEASQLSRQYAIGMDTVMRNTFTVSLRKLRNNLKDNSTDFDKTLLSNDLIINSNLKQAEQTGFTQFSFTSISRKPQLMQIAQDTSTIEATQNPVHGLSLLGTLRVGINQPDQIVSFQETDSGSLVTFAGVVPLMVLNTVDGDGVSGGASILALPEAGPEESSPVNTTAEQSSPKSGNPKNTTSRVPKTACR